MRENKDALKENAYLAVERYLMSCVSEIDTGYGEVNISYSMKIDNGKPSVLKIKPSTETCLKYRKNNV